MLTRVEDYTIGWICAIPTEYTVACELLDEEYDAPKIDTRRDDNAYTFGLIGEHKIVIATLPHGRYGNTSAALVGERMRQTFPNIRFALMVGIAGGAPSQKHDIRLGDIVVSSPTSRHGGVIQYDFGKTIQEQAFEETGYLTPPPTILLNALGQLIAKHERKGHKIAETADVFAKNRRLRAKYTRPPKDPDILYKSTYTHSNDGTCDCQRFSKAISESGHERSIYVSRVERGADSDDPVIHYGLIASANQLMKDAVVRDTLIKKHDVLCFEMESAGLMNSLPCLVIRGICDYSDTHKNDVWHGYAAVTAAGYAKELLNILRPIEVEQTNSSIASPKAVNEVNTSLNTYIMGQRKNIEPGLSRSTTLLVEDAVPSRESLYMIPMLQNRRFVGRENKLAELQEKCFTNDEIRQLAIFGLGGVGKTQLALAFCYVVKARYPDYSIFWLSALSSARFQQDYTKLARTCSLPANVSGDELIEQVKDYFGSSLVKWLLVVDNADDKTLLFNEGGILDSLPQAEDGLILFTTRYKDVASDLADGNILNLEEMELNEAKNFLAKSLKRDDDLLQDTEAAEDLLKELQYLPLAIAQASSYMIKCSITIPKYLALMKGSEEETIKLLSREFRDNTRQAQSAVAVTWLVSFEQIKEEEPAAADILFAIACLENKAIPSRILPSEGSEGDLVHAIGILVGYSFLSQQGEVYDMHRLVHTAIKIWMQREEITDTWWERIVAHLVDVFPVAIWENRNLWRELMPHAIRVLQNTEGMADTIPLRATLCLCVGQCLMQDDRYSEAIKWTLECVSWRDQSLGREDSVRLVARDWLARMYTLNGQPAKAIEILKEVVDIEAGTLTEEDSSRLHSLNNLGIAYTTDGQVEEAVAILEKVVAIRARTLPEDDTSLLISRNNLADAYNLNRETEKAAKILEEVVAAYKRTLPEGHPSLLMSQANLSYAYRSNGQFREAMKILEDVVAKRKKYLREDHPLLLIAQHNLATSYESNGRLDEGISLLQYVVSVRKISLPESHRDRASSERALSYMLRERDRRNLLDQKVVEEEEEADDEEVSDEEASDEETDDISEEGGVEEGEAEEKLGEALEEQSTIPSELKAKD